VVLVGSLELHDTSLRWSCFNEIIRMVGINMHELPGVGIQARGWPDKIYTVFQKSKPLDNDFDNDFGKIMCTDFQNSFTR